MESGTKQQRQQHHFVLVHGACHGAWCWYKVATLLSSAGHRVTALDMAACGASPGRAEEVPSLQEYSRPLLAAVAGLQPEEKAVLVGHSFGGLSLALAMEQCPDRVAVAVFVSALMPAAGKPMAFVFEQLSQEEQPADRYMDCKFETSVAGDPQHPVETFRFGPQYMKKRLYQLSPPEDLTLAMTMVRPSQRFRDDTTMNGNVLTAERYGAVRRVCVVAEDDASLPAGFQRRMASWNPGTEWHTSTLQGEDKDVSPLPSPIKVYLRPDPTNRRGQRTMESGMKQRRRQHHFVLVHGACHGAWCWYKVATLLSSAGHRVTALDMAACGASPGRAEEVPSFEEYSRQLLVAVAGLPPDEKAVLVGHIFGGMSLALAMEWYPDRVAVAIFVAAAMPAAGKPMAFVFEQVSQQEHPADRYMDCKFETGGDPQHPVETFRFGPRYLKQRLYQLSPTEDLTLAMAMVRPSQRFQDDATMKGNVLTAERYGAVRRVSVVAEDDATVPAAFQRRTASWNPGTEVMGLQGADHMVMLSKPRELSELLMEIADKYII